MTAQELIIKILKKEIKIENLTQGELHIISKRINTRVYSITRECVKIEQRMFCNKCFFHNTNVPCTTNLKQRINKLIN